MMTSRFPSVCDSQWGSGGSPHLPRGHGQVFSDLLRGDSNYSGQRWWWFGSAWNQQNWWEMIGCILNRANRISCKVREIQPLRLSPRPQNEIQSNTLKDDRPNFAQHYRHVLCFLVHTDVTAADSSPCKSRVRADRSWALVDFTLILDRGFFSYTPLCRLEL